MKTKKRLAFSLIELSIVILVIGILVAATTQAGDLMRNMKLVAARSVTNSSTITSIDDLDLWLETSTIASFQKDSIADGEFIDKWYDINPTTTNKTQAVSSGNNRPKYKADCIAGIPCLDFDKNSNSYIDLEKDFGSKYQISIFVVLQLKSLVNTFYRILTTDGAWLANNLHIQIRDGNRFGYSVNGKLSHYSYNNTVMADKKYILNIIDSGSQVTIYINGIQSSSVASFTGIRNYRKFNIGNWFDGTTRANDTSLDAYLSEIIIFDRGLKDSERKSVESYLGQKYNIDV